MALDPDGEVKNLSLNLVAAVNISLCLLSKNLWERKNFHTNKSKEY